MNDHTPPVDLMVSEGTVREGATALRVGAIQRRRLLPVWRDRALLAPIGGGRTVRSWWWRTGLGEMALADVAP